MKQLALLDPTNVKILSVNPRRELFGKERILAVDVGVRLRTSNMVLDQLRGPAFRHAFCEARAVAAEPPAQAELDGVELASETPDPRFEKLSPLKLQDVLTGYLAVFDVGTGRRESLIEMPSARLSNFQVEFMRGGTMDLTFRIQASRLQETTLGKLCALIDSDAPLMLVPPSDGQQEIEPTSEGGDGSDAGHDDPSDDIDA